MEIVQNLFFAILKQFCCFFAKTAQNLEKMSLQRFRGAGLPRANPVGITGVQNSSPENLKNSNNLFEAISGIYFAKVAKNLDKRVWDNFQGLISRQFQESFR